MKNQTAKTPTKAADKLEIKTFNTGRPYTAQGQRIAWAVSGGKTHFVDFDRMISGTINHSVESLNDVLYCYDNNIYQHLGDYEVRSQLEVAAKSL